MNIQESLGQLIEAFIEIAINYLVFAIPFFMVFWVVWKKQFKSIRIQEVERATSHHFKHDVLHSFSSLFIFAFLDVVLFYLYEQGYTQLYLDINQYGWAWAIISLAIFLFINDAFFYWSHRAMHHPKLYKFFHRVQPHL